MTLLERVRGFAIRHDLWRPPTLGIVALSGGSDSVALLLLLHEFATHGEVVLDAAAHLNHSIRGRDADEDEAFCGELCARLMVPFVASRIDVPAKASLERVSLEVAARRARHAFLEQVRESRAADFVATAHTEDDQAETVLLRIVRGAGTRGLAGILPRRRHLIRPLLACSRDELRAYLTSRDQTWREDETNQDVTNPRNRVRHDLLPYLARHFNPSVRASLARLAEVARGDEIAIGPLVEAASADIVRVSTEEVSLDAAALNALPEGLARRVIQNALTRIRPDRICNLRDVDLVLAVAKGGPTAAEFSGLRVERFDDSAVLVKRARNLRPRRRGAGTRVPRR